MTASNPALENPNSTRIDFNYLARLLALHPGSIDVMLAAANAALQGFSPTHKLSIEGDYLVVRALDATEIHRLLIQAKQAEDINHGKVTSESVKKDKIVAGSRDKRVAYLHEEVVFTILSRLPADCLRDTMRYVCNTWARIIRNPSFVEAHLQHSKRGLFLQNYSMQIYPQPSFVSEAACFLEFKENGDFEFIHLDRYYPGRVMSSCDGILVLQKSFKVLNVGNPIIMDIVHQVPSMGNCHTSIARLPNNGGFKLVCSKSESGGWTSWHVLALGIDDSWRKLGSHYSTSWHKPLNPIPIGQFIYWTPESDYSIDQDTIDIIITDIVEESVSKFSFPIEKFCKCYFVKIGNSLSLIHITSNTKCDIYVAKDVYIGGWEIYHQIDLDVGSPKRRIFYDLQARPVACLDKELILLVKREEWFMLYFGYNMKKQRIRILYEPFGFEIYNAVCVHSNTLVS